MKSYLRFLSRNKRYTAIQVVGLSVSLAFVIILASWLVNIVKMGHENPDYEDIYAVCYQDSFHTTWALGEHLADNIPEIETTSTVLLYPGHFTLKNADCVKINWCEENFFDFFPREFIAGGIDAREVCGTDFAKGFGSYQTNLCPDCRISYSF